MSAKIKDLFPSTSWSIQLLPRQRRGLGQLAQNGNITFDVVSQQDLEQIIFWNLVLIESHDKEFQELFLLILTKENMTDTQCSAVWCRYQGCSGWVVGRIVRCHNAGPGDLETSSCRLPSEPLSIVLTSNISYVFMDRGSSGTSWVLSCECFTLDMVTASKKYLHRYRSWSQRSLILNLFPGNSFTATAKIL